MIPTASPFSAVAVQYRASALVSVLPHIILTVWSEMVKHLVSLTPSFSFF
jgi:hypothetical protein